jgi:hypothetical protein
MCALKWLYAIRYLGFQLWWLYKRAKLCPSPLVFLEFLCMKAASIFYLDFLDAHSGYYTTTVYIELHSFFAILFNSRKIIFLVASCWKQQISCAFEILELLLLVLLLPEGARYYCCYWCCWRELCVSYNQPSWDKQSRDTREQVLKLFSFSHSFSLFKLLGKKNKNAKML